MGGRCVGHVPPPPRFFEANVKSLILTIGAPQGRTQDFGSGEGEASDKISYKVARISVWGGDIQQKFTQQRLLKNFEKFI